MLGPFAHPSAGIIRIRLFGSDCASLSALRLPVAFFLLSYHNQRENVISIKLEAMLSINDTDFGFAFCCQVALFVRMRRLPALYGWGYKDEGYSNRIL
mgnify:CR=1 FL=1